MHWLTFELVNKAVELCQKELESALGEAFVVHVVDEIKLLDKHSVDVVGHAALKVTSYQMRRHTRLPLLKVLLQRILEPGGYFLGLKGDVSVERPHEVVVVEHVFQLARVVFQIWVAHKVLRLVRVVPGEKNKVLESGQLIGIDELAQVDGQYLLNVFHKKLEYLVRRRKTWLA